MPWTVNLERLKKDIEELGRIGQDPNPNGGISRPSFSIADLDAREWLKEKILAAGLELRQDGAGNIFGHWGEGEKTVMAGSHIDTVLNGGRFDGAIGVLAALECLRRLKEEGFSPKNSLEVASFTDEEGNLVGDFLGSRAFTGRTDKELLEKGVTSYGQSLSELLEETEFSIESIMETQKERPDIEAFLELHIEQGSVLETEGKSIGIVERIAGKHYWSCRFIGQSGHGGTTPIELRHDAFLGLADFTLRSTQYVATHHYGSTLTIGKVHTFPGSFSVIPGVVEFSLDFRSPAKDELDKISSYNLALAEDIAATRGLRFEYIPLDHTEPVDIPSRLKNTLESGCKDLGFSFMSISSGAGHDAQILSSITDAGMIFIPCEDGISHSPEENIQWEDLERGANLLLYSLVKLSE